MTQPTTTPPAPHSTCGKRGREREREGGGREGERERERLAIKLLVAFYKPLMSRSIDIIFHVRTSHLREREG